MGQSHKAEPCALSRLLHAYKPAVSPKIHLILAGFLWSAVGLFLFIRGILNLAKLQDLALWITPLSILIGLLKGHFILERAARKNLKRITDKIEKRGKERFCIGGFQSFRSWGLILMMIFMGRMLRMSLLPRALVWATYVGIGTGLLVASRVYWNSLMGIVGKTPPPGP